MAATEELTSEEIGIALRILDQVGARLLSVGSSRDDMIKENYRRDALALNRAAEILEPLADPKRLRDLMQREPLS